MEKLNGTGRRFLRKLGISQEVIDSLDSDEGMPPIPVIGEQLTARGIATLASVRYSLPNATGKTRPTAADIQRVIKDLQEARDEALQDREETEAEKTKKRRGYDRERKQRVRFEKHFGTRLG